MSWQAVSSCSPLTGSEIQCADKNNNFWPLKSIYGSYLTYTVDNSRFLQTPFNLQPGEPLYCKIRGYNKNGTGPWSVQNRDYAVQSCGKKVE